MFAHTTRLTWSTIARHLCSYSVHSEAGQFDCEPPVQETFVGSQITVLSNLRRTPASHAATWGGGVVNEAAEDLKSWRSLIKDERTALRALDD